jgi:hypothetical protein
MGQFKPMVKMFTDEPSVILKLKKGGKVASKADGESEGFKSMAHSNAKMYEASEHGSAPKKPSMSERRKAMNPNQYAKGGKVAKHEDATQDRAMIKKALAGKKFASGGAIDREETRTTIEGNAKKFEKTKVNDGQKHDKHHGTKAIKEGKPAGYKTGGAIPADTHEKVNKGKIKMHGTIEGNEHDYVNTQVHQAKHDKAHGTKGIKEGKPAGYKVGGKVPDIGRAVEGNEAKFALNNVDDGDKFDPAHGTKGVRESNAGGYKKGGHTKKAYATGGNVVDDGKAEKMPRHFISRPVANSLQSGTFKKGGKVDRKADGGLEDMSKGAYDKAVNEKPMGSGFAGKVQGAIDKFFNYKKPAGTVTETKETVTTNKKRGGKC